MFCAGNNMENLARGSRLEAKMRFEVNSITTLKGEAIMSEPTIIGNVPWRIVVKPHPATHSGGGNTLAISIRCDGDAGYPYWECKANATLKLVTKSLNVGWKGSLDHTFNSESNEASHWESHNIIPWYDLVDPDNEFLNQGKLSIETGVTLEEPAASHYDSISDFGRSEAFLRFRLNFKIFFKDSVNYSPPTYMKNLPWRIETVAYPENRFFKKTLGIYLKCLGDPESQEWSCKVNGKIFMTPQQPGTLPFVGETWSHTFSQEKNQFGLSDFITFKELSDRTKGFIKDGFLQIEIDFKAADACVGPENQGSNNGIMVPRIHLECPICMELPRGEVYQCRNGHFLCADCNNKVHFCPQCRCRLSLFGERLRSIETILDDVEMNCRYKEKGCNFKTLRKHLSLHENSCGFRCD